MKTFFASCFKSFTSRKFLVAVVTAFLLFFDKQLGLGLNIEEKAIAAGIGAFWILAESAIDFQAVKGFNLDKGIARLNQIMPIVQEVFKQIGNGKPLDLGGLDIKFGAAPAPGVFTADGQPILDDIVKQVFGQDPAPAPSGATTNIPDPTFAGKPDEQAPKAG